MSVETQSSIERDPYARARDPGLNAQQVAERRQSGNSNDVPDTTSRTTADILKANVLTRINAILGVLLVVALFAGSPIDALFGFLILANSGVGIVQEVRAKRTLDRLAILNISRPLVRRAGTTAPLDARDVVVDDVIEVGPGDQVIVDGRVIESAGLEVDESLLTGEAEAIDKHLGSALLSGSFIVAGTGAYRATAVGRDAYSARLANQAKKFSPTRSELRAGIDRILGFVTILIIPAGALIIYSQLFTSGQPLAPALVGTVAALVPMVPEGLVLMTSIALALGVIRLGRFDCLVQELAAIEALARVDVVCIDKTGTLTEPAMELLELISCGGTETAMGRQVLASMVAADPRPNATLAAIGAGVGAIGSNVPPAAYVPFSSARKWQGIESATLGSWVLGAPDVLLDPSSDVVRRAEAIGSQGLRAVLLGRVERLPKGDILPVVHPELLVVLDQRLRPDARATLEYFARQGVSVKVLSGDSVASVQAVARALAIDGWNKASDARDLPADERGMGDALEAHSIFGRVRPEQKRAMIEAFRARGHTVAMMGDGVNDVLALKMADVGVAMGSGSPATRAVAQIVLLSNAFAALPKAVAEGRRVIGNVERISNLFLSKTVYSTLLALLVGGWGLMASLLNTEPLPFPFLPRHVMLSAWFTIGIPAFILSLAPADDRARPGFVSRVLRLAIPSGAAVTLMTLTSYALASWGHGFAQAGTSAQASTAALTTLVVVMLHVLSVVSRPYRWWKIGLIAASVLTYLTIFSWPLAQSFFVLDLSSARAVATGIGCGIIGAMLVEVAWRVARLEGSQPVRE